MMYLLFFILWVLFCAFIIAFFMGADERRRDRWWDEH